MQKALNLGGAMRAKFAFLMMSFFLTGVAFSSWATQTAAQETVNYRTLCQQARQDLKSCEKELGSWKKEKDPIQKERAQVEKKFFTIQESIKKQSGCSEGDPDNTPQCQKDLEEARRLGKKMNELDARMAKVNRKFRKIDRDKLLAEKKLEVYRCR